MNYDKENIFAKILRGEIPCEKVYEDEYVLSFRDINPEAKMDVLIIPKDEYIDIADFLQKSKPKLNIVTITIVEQDAIDELEEEYKGLADYIIAIPSDMTKTY